MTQPALSRQIEKLEEELQCKLFERDRRSVQLTQNGKVCYRYARDVLESYDNLLDAMHLQRRSMTGTLHIGYGGRSHLNQLIQSMEMLRSKHPLLHVDLRKDHIEGLKWGLRMGVDDLVFLFEPCVEEEWMEKRVVATLQMEAVLPANHPLAKEPHIPLIALRDERFVTSDRKNQPQIYDTRIRLCMEAGFSPKIERTVKTAEAACVEVCTNSMVTLLPKDAIDPKLPNIVAVPLEGLQGTFNIVVAWKRGSANPHVKAFVDCLSEIRV